MESDDDDFGGVKNERRIKVCKNGSAKEPKELVVSESWDMSQLLRALGRLLQFPVKRVFNAEGLEFDDISMLTDGDHVFCSDGDEFRSPMSHKSSRNLWNTQAATSRSAASSIPHGTIVAGYKVGRVLGQGGFGCVRLGQHSLTGQLVALKFLSKSLFASATDADRVITEISCLTDLEHPNIIKLQGVHQEAGSMVIALDFAPGGDLKAYLLRKGGKLTEEDARQKFTQILRGIQYAHNRGIAHRDLKLENVLMGPKDVCLITDFGLSQYAARDEKTASTGGSLFYLAPELVHGDLSNGQQVDVWCLGIMLYLLLVGELPFMSPAICAAMKKLKEEAATAPESAGAAAEVHGGAEVEGDHHHKSSGTRDFFMEACRLVDHRAVFKEVKKCICAGKFIIPDTISTSAADLLVSILRQKPTNRLTIGEIFAHPWIRSSNVFQGQGEEASSDVSSLFGFAEIPKPARAQRPAITISASLETVAVTSARATALSPTLSPEPVKSPLGEAELQVLDSHSERPALSGTIARPMLTRHQRSSTLALLSTVSSPPASSTPDSNDADRRRKFQRGVSQPDLDRCNRVAGTGGRIILESVKLSIPPIIRPKPEGSGSELFEAGAEIQSESIPAPKPSLSSMPLDRRQRELLPDSAIASVEMGAPTRPPAADSAQVQGGSLSPSHASTPLDGKDAQADGRLAADTRSTSEMTMASKGLTFVSSGISPSLGTIASPRPGLSRYSWAVNSPVKGFGGAASVSARDLYRVPLPHLTPPTLSPPTLSPPPQEPTPPAMGARHLHDKLSRLHNVKSPLSPDFFAPLS